MAWIGTGGRDESVSTALGIEKASDQSPRAFTGFGPGTGVRRERNQMRRYLDRHVGRGYDSEITVRECSPSVTGDQPLSIDGGSTMGLLDSIKNAAAAANAREQAQKNAEATLRMNPGCVVISTGGVSERYDVIEAIFAMDSHGTELFANADPAAAFEGLKQKLRTQAVILGANGVIHCQFQYRVSLGEGMFGGKKQCIELFAYGTAVKRHGVESPA